MSCSSFFWILLYQGLLSGTLSTILNLSSVGTSVSVVPGSLRRHKTILNQLSAFSAQRLNQTINRNTNKSSNFSPNVCSTEACQNAAEEIKKYMNASADPCEDFYEYACGNYAALHTIPDDEVEVSVFHELSQKILDDLQDILDEPVENETSRARRTARELYQLCLDEDAIEELGARPLLDLLNTTLGGWPLLTPNWNASQFDLWRTLTMLDHMGFAPLIGTGVTADLRNSSINVVSVGVATGFSKNLLNSSLGRKYIACYPQLMRNVTLLLADGCQQTFCNWSTIQDQLDPIVDFYKFLTNLSTTTVEALDFDKFYNVFSLSTVESDIFFRSNFSKGFRQFLENALAPGDLQHLVTDNLTIIVPKRESIAAFDKKMVELEEMGDKGKRFLANFLGWRLTSVFGRELSKPFQDAFKIQSQILSGTNKTDPVWKRCIYMVAAAVPQAVGSMYVQMILDDNVKAKVTEMVRDIRQSFQAMLKHAPWMDETTRLRAYNKLDAMMEYVTYPEFYLNNQSRIEELYENITVQETMFETTLTLSRAANVRTVKRLSKRNFREEVNERLYTATNNAQYLPQSNFIAIFAGLTQYPMFDAQGPDYVNYGRLGYVIGHEITHGFDDIGSRFDEHGDMVDWWTKYSKKEYKRKAKAMINQYNAYTTPFGKVDGNLTLSENIADSGGLKAAFHAYKSHLQHKTGRVLNLPGLETHTPEMMFFLSASQVWCGRKRPEQEELNLIRDSHSPCHFRVNGPLSNLPEFAKVYQCPTGSAMTSQRAAGIW